MSKPETTILFPFSWSCPDHPDAAVDTISHDVHNDHGSVSTVAVQCAACGRLISATVTPSEFRWQS